MDTQTMIPELPIDDYKDITGEIVPEKKFKYIEPGKRIKDIRCEKNISIEKLSRLTGFSEAFLINIEKRTIQPQLGTLIRLSKALDSAVGSLISDSGEKQYAIVRKGESQKVARSTSGSGKRQAYQYSSLSADVKGKHMESFMVALKENSDEELSSHEGEEFIHILEGEVVFRIGIETHYLNPGDSIYYLSTTPHQLTAKNGSAKVLATIYEG